MNFYLPQIFLQRMRQLLQDDEYKAYLSLLTRPYFKGVRINTLKYSADKARALFDFALQPSPFCRNGYYIPYQAQALGKTAMHHAGAFYVQEPSATSAVTVLAPEKGDKVLDLCAAPGGKSTQIGAQLAGSGLLWSNEVVKNRTGALLSNIERMGIRNAVVSCCHPQQLCDSLAGFFDKVLVDAPCSGEGMFRKDEQARLQWSETYVRACAERQLSILQSAAKAVKAGGVLVYSTCTFSAEENEGVLEKFLQRENTFVLEDANVPFGRPAMEKARRIFPMDGGEGHFVARLRKQPGSEGGCAATPCLYSDPFTGKNKPLRSLAEELYDSIFQYRIFGSRFAMEGDRILLLPKDLPQLHGLHVLRAGVLLGQVRKNRIEPAHGAFMAATPGAVALEIPLCAKSDMAARFLRGEEIPCEKGQKGYAAVSVDGVITGFGKCVNGILKNKYPKGLRNI
ncbi:MAG TPA: RsmB/NOP family class I SAM-dependent RNA methyltransferase [Candidatus Scatavimonas merdigallinarum]|uniref:RsmB/NOP family class I SAM-dependent RNA methyltransferase n=1 Tax=Candidatus Scatavimonas merdigallinarum TaxID=2840914 RepID=A0A9D1CU06_9FIRM|nr:RsmB/NOP family class I SAM-dependent RNA methyltransferase [Candidatus Scatavimonas merdigallinarum]